MLDSIKIKIGIAGCGKVAELHAKAIENLKDASLDAVWSRTSETAQKFAKKHHTKAFEFIEPMVGDKNLDFVIICTPHPFHVQPAIEAANAGANVLVEKPLASTIKDVKLIIDACERNRVKLGVISQRRWYEPVKRLRQAVEDGKTGKPILGTVSMLGWRDKAYYDSDAWRGTWEMEGGGVLVNQAPHQLDLLLWLMGEIDEVYGTWANLNHPYIEVEDTALAIIKFKNGGLGNVILSNSMKPGIHGKVHIHGDLASAGVQTEGGAMFIAGSTGIQEAPYNDLWTIPGEEHKMDKWKQQDKKEFFSSDPTIRYLEYQIQDFVQAIRNEHKPAVTGYDGLRVVELITAIYRSQRDNAPIKFPVKPEVDHNDMDGRSSH